MLARSRPIELRTWLMLLMLSSYRAPGKLRASFSSWTCWSRVVNIVYVLWTLLLLVHSSHFVVLPFVGSSQSRGAVLYSVAELSALGSLVKLLVPVWWHWMCVIWDVVKPNEWTLYNCSSFFCDYVLWMNYWDVCIITDDNARTFVGSSLSHLAWSYFVISSSRHVW